MTALQKLPARMRAVLVLRYWEDQSEAETAALLNCSVGTVKSQAARGLTRLREVLASDEGSSGFRPATSLPAVRPTPPRPPQNMIVGGNA
jgi:hypothetical protein